MAAGAVAGRGATRVAGADGDAAAREPTELPVGVRVVDGLVDVAAGTAADRLRGGIGR